MVGQGGLLQLVAIGKQDVFLTGNPQMTWFKMVYRRYTNFAIESQPMYFDGTPDFGKRITCKVPRRGDLLSQVILEVSLPALQLTDGTDVPYVNSIGHALIQEISVEVGEQEIDRQNGEWMEIWSNYTTTADKQTGFYNMIGKMDGYSTHTQNGPVKLYIPLRFWFCRNPGLALPLLALQYHPVRINLTLRPLSKLFYTPQLTTTVCPNIELKPASIESLMLWGDYIHLDVEERRRFVSSTHEYLIEQVQYTQPLPIAPGATSANLQLEFNHPIRELFWFIQRDDMTRYHEYYNYSSVGVFETGVRKDILQDAVLQLDGFDRFPLRDAGYFRLVQPWQYHTVVPEDFFVYSYSFALRPEDAQPSGSMNASRMDSMVLQVNLDPNVVTPLAGAASFRATWLSGSTTLTLVSGVPIINAVLNALVLGIPAAAYITGVSGNTISISVATTLAATTPTAVLQTTQCNVGTLNARVYAINHNVFRIADGFGGVLFTI